MYKTGRNWGISCAMLCTRGAAMDMGPGSEHSRAIVSQLICSIRLKACGLCALPACATGGGRSREVQQQLPGRQGCRHRRRCGMRNGQRWSRVVKLMHKDAWILWDLLENSTHGYRLSQRQAEPPGCRPSRAGFDLSRAGGLGATLRGARLHIAGSAAGRCWQQPPGQHPGGTQELHGRAGQ